MRTSRGSGMSEEYVRASLWFWPAVSAVLAFVLTLPLLAVRPPPSSRLAQIAFPGDASTAASVLQTVATSVMTAMTVSFSLTVVALQMASQQFSPRLLREFARDRLIQAVLAVLLSTFVVALTGLRGWTRSGRCRSSSSGWCSCWGWPRRWRCWPSSGTSSAPCASTP